MYFRATRHCSRGPSRGYENSFTLIELLVVIAIIAILAALLLPALSKGKVVAQSVACLSNLKQLQICCHLYSVDFNDYLPPNDSDAAVAKGTSWLPDLDADMEINPSNIVNGLLFQYNTSLPIYHCPADQSTLETSSGQPLPQLRWRSYNMSQSVNGYQDYNAELQFLPSWKKFTQIRHPIPSALFVFIDENEETIEDAEFGNPPVGSPYYVPNIWWDMPANRHNQGANLSFADGHVEHWHWKVPKIFYDWWQPVPTAEMPDYTRIQNAMKQPADD
jgi:prepilin-type processing-associated H-X9-DG protein/prepilin-type N-terminal cleavage/methylation domain-containing protein